MKPIFHIGYPKTATSWFQQNFFPFVKNGTYIPRRETFRTFIQPNCFDFDPVSIRKKYNNIASERIIFSLEGFIGTNHNFGLNGYLTLEHANRIKKTFPEAEIVIFIKNQPDIITSAYIQYIKGGGTYGINKFLYHKNLRNLGGLLLFNWNHFEYHNVIDLYTNLFGIENVYIFLFEDFISNISQFIKNFSETLRLETDLSKISIKKVNPSYRRIIKFLALISNRFTERKMPNKYYLVHIPGWFRFSKRIFNKLNTYSIFGKHLDSGDILTQKNLKKICEYYKNSNRILIEKYNLTGIKKYKYPL